MRTALALATATVLAAADPAALLPNGNFEQLNGTAPVGWNLPAGASLEVEKGNHFLRLTAGGAGKTIQLYRQIDLAQAKAVRIAWKERHADVKRGAQPWHDARIIMDFKDADGKVVKPGPPHPFYTGSAGWSEKSVVVEIPSAAVAMTFMPAIFEAESGTFDLDDITITPAKPGDDAAKPAKR